MTRLRFIGILFVIMLLGVLPTRAQGQISDILSMSVDAGYDGRYRPNQWFPLQIEINNQGPDISGRVIVRPETSGTSLLNAYSTPVNIAGGSTQNLTLYVSARSNANNMRVELITDEGGIALTQSFNLRSLLPRDRLYAVLSGSATGTVDVSGASVAAYEAFQANWQIEDIPEVVSALDPVDAMLFTDIDTADLSPAQRDAIRNWVLRGGHLVLTSGLSYQAVSAGFDDLLPLNADDTQSVENLNPLGTLAGLPLSDALDSSTTIATGQLAADATVLAETGDGLPLVARRDYGYGTVDFIAADFSSQPLREWSGLTDLWFTLLTSTEARPSWADGFSDWSEAVTAVEILPGVSLLPAALGLIVFLGAYIVLIGPVNYFLLSRFNRRELAWISTPIFIAVFSVLAWSFGAELRGNTATLSRLSVVQSWQESDQARIDQLIGLLAPRRGDYTLTLEDDRTLRPITSDLNDSVFTGTNTNVEISQNATFEAVDFPVDASFIAAFNADGMIEKPDIGGSMVMRYDRQTGNQILQGTVFNDSDVTLEQPVMLARGVAYELGTPLEPGDLVTLADITLTGETFTPPTSLELSTGDDDPHIGSSPTGFTGRLSSYVDEATRTARDILGEDAFTQGSFGISLTDDAETQERRRRQAFLTSFILDQYATTGRGNNVYLVGWGAGAPTAETVDGAGYEVVDTTLYIVELAVEIDPARTTTVTQDQFTWVSLAREGVGDLGPNNINLYSDSELIFRFTPLPSARLDRVDTMTLQLDFGRQTFGENSIDLWNWQDSEWESIELGSQRSFVLNNPAPYLGPLNAVEMRIVPDNIEGQIFIDNIGVEQTGGF
jgi:hypothetical protein